MKLSLCAEPTGAGAIIIHYAKEEYNKLLQNKQKYESEELVVDMGGGTTDFTRFRIVGYNIDRKITWRYENLAITGCPLLGGTDISQVITDHYTGVADGALGKPIKELEAPVRAQANNRLRQIAESCKVALVTSPEVKRTIYIAGSTIEVELDRQKLKEITNPLMVQFKTQLRKVIGNSPINKIHLIGGSSKLYPVLEAIRAILPNVTMNHVNNNRTIVAEGGCFVGMIKAKAIKDFEVFFTNPFSIGIGIFGDVLETIIPIRTSLPFIRTYPDHWNATKTRSISALVYEGNKSKASANRLLGQVKLQLSREYDVGQASLAVKADMNDDCMMSIECYERNCPQNRGTFITDIEKIHNTQLYNEKHRQKNARFNDEGKDDTKHSENSTQDSTIPRSPPNTNSNIISRLQISFKSYVTILSQQQQPGDKYSYFKNQCDNNTYTEDEWRILIKKIKAYLQELEDNTDNTSNNSRKRSYDKMSESGTLNESDHEQDVQNNPNPPKKQKTDT